MSAIQGGSFGHGFASAAVTQAATGRIDNIGGNGGARVAAAALVGGSVSALTGGKFVNGALTAAFSRAFNDETENNGGASQDQEAINVDAAIQKIEEIALSNYMGRCAKHVRLALEAGGADMSARPTYAKDYGPKLVELNFSEIPVENYVAERGDIVVFENYATQSVSAGHIQMYSGTSWISDTVQPRFLPHQVNYKDVPYAIYRP